MGSIGGTYEEEIAPTFESTKARIEQERKNRGSLHHKLTQQIKNIPDDDVNASNSVKMVQGIIEQTFGVIRCVVADQMQLYSESFFLLPMLRRLEGAMANLELEEEEKKSDSLLADLTYCIAAVQKFKVTCGGGQ